MKLLCCHIFHFGGLSDFTMDFNEGLTVIEEENGFGKTTLAEFIRAMFYGFPRSSGRTLGKNLRRKYQPWQGGRYGGTLTFQHAGKCYRIERTFGKTRAGDSFHLTEGENQHPSRDFSENIGEELFQLDADSFERSTYLPQAHSFDTLTTAKIQAKLGNLVDDTNDINNFEKAMEALRKKRSGYQAFRGDGGRISQTQAEISALQETLAALAPVPAQLQRERQHKQQMEEEQAVHQGALEKIRTQILKTSEAASIRTIQQHHEALCRQRDTAQQAAEALRQTLPQQLPTVEELEQLLPVWDELSALQDAGEEDPAYRAARQTAQEHQQRFAEGIPNDVEIEQYELKNTEYISTFSAAQGLCLSPQEENRRQALTAFFTPGLPEEEALTQLRRSIEDRRQLEQQAAAEQLSAADRETLGTLEAFFAPGVPTAEELAAKQQSAARITALQQENVRITAQQRPQAAASTPPAARKSRGLVPLLLAVLACVAGVVLLVQKLYVPGAVLGVAGVVVLLLALPGYIRQAVRSELSTVPAVPVLGAAEQEQLRCNQQEIQRLEQELETFCARYLPQPGPVGERLASICAKQSLYQSLLERRQGMMVRRRQLNAQMTALQEGMDAFLQRYFQTIGSYEQCLTALQTRREEYLTLCRKQEELAHALRENTQRAEVLCREIGDFLQPFYGSVSPADFGKYLGTLRRDSDVYARACRQLDTLAQAAQKRTASRESCTARIADFNKKYGLHLPVENRQPARQLREQLLEYDRRQTAAQAAEAALQQDERDHAAQLAAAVTEETLDMDALKRAEAAQKQAVDALTAELLEQEQKLRLLEQKAEQLPQKQDALERLSAQKQEDTAARDLLDQTMELMAQAKEELNTGYLSDIKKSFAHYMELLDGTQQEGVALDTDLGVRLERDGTARELEYFSAGQSDIVMLCMRLALVDALFKETKPFLVLDDPFVNLDDAHTAQALRLLQTLGKDHQILYMVCNSSRSL